MIKIACVHTGAGAPIYGIIEEQIRKNIRVPYEIRHMTNPSIIADVAAHDRVTPYAAAELTKMYAAGLSGGCDIILNMCSSVGEAADAAKELLDMAGCTLIKIDQRMSREAVRRHTKIALAATLASTLPPSRRLLERCAAEIGSGVQITPILASGAFGADPKALTEAIVRSLEASGAEMEAIVFAQASMCGCAEAVSDRFGVPVYTSPAFAAMDVADAAKRIFEKEKQS